MRIIFDPDWRGRMRTVVEAARAVVSTADEFPPEDIAEGACWEGGDAMSILNEAVDAVFLGTYAPIIHQCRGCLDVAPSDEFKALDAAGWWYTPPSISPDAPDLYCPECRTMLREAINR